MKEYVIRWDLKPKSYFTEMTAGGPRFGAKLKTTPRFDSERAAMQVVGRFPLVAAAGSDVVPVKARSVKHRKSKTVSLVYDVFAYFPCNSSGVRVATRRTEKAALRFALIFGRRNRVETYRKTRLVS